MLCCAALLAAGVLSGHVGPTRAPPPIATASRAALEQLHSPAASAEAEWADMPFGVDEETLKRRFRTLAARYHPDRNDAEDAVERFQALSKEYERRLRECRTAAQAKELEAQWITALAPIATIIGLANTEADPLFSVIAAAVLGGVTIATDGAIWSDLAIAQNRQQRARARPMLRSALARLLPDADGVTQQLLGLGETRSAEAISRAVQRLQEKVKGAQSDARVMEVAMRPIASEARWALWTAGSKASRRWAARNALFEHGPVPVAAALLYGSGATSRTDAGATPAYGELGSVPMESNALEDALALAIRTADAAEAAATSERKLAAAAARSIARFEEAETRLQVLMDELAATMAEADAAAAFEAKDQSGGIAMLRGSSPRPFGHNDEQRYGALA